MLSAEPTLLVGYAAACPANWDNPCIIDDTSHDLAPITWKKCPDQYDLGTAVENRAYFGAQGQYGSPEGLVTGSDITNIQQCSNVCTNHPECTAFTFEANSEHGTAVMRNENDCWGNFATSSSPSSNTCSGTIWVRGTCHLYSQCKPTEYEDYRPSGSRGFKMWHLGNDNDNGFCTNPKGGDGSVYDVNSGPSACEAGLELKDGECHVCAAGTFKVGFNSNACVACRACHVNQFQKVACGTMADTACFTHSDTCANDEYQSVAPSATSDRQCTTCKTCAAGSMVGFGCNRHDPWTTTKWHSDAAGAATGALSLFQTPAIADRVMVVHVGSQKVSCGPVLPFFGACPNRDTWSTQRWSSGAAGVASSAAVTGCLSESLDGRVVVIHDSGMKKVGCGKFVKQAAGAGGDAGGGGGVYVAVVDKIDGSPGFRDISGSVTLTHTGSAITGEFSLSGLEASQTGMWHVHEGSTCANPGGHLLNRQFGYTATVVGLPNANPTLPDSAVSGVFNLKQTDAQLIGNYALTGLPGGSSGAFHMHAGSSCAAPGLHLGNSQATAHTHEDEFSGQRRIRRLAEAAEASHPLPTDLTSNGDTVCTPCVPGISFSTAPDSAACAPIAECAVGTYETQSATATADGVCGACTNGPAASAGSATFEYTSRGGVTSDCLFKCKPNFVASNDGAECVPTVGATIAFKGGGEVSKLIKLKNNVLTFSNFKCVEAPEFCGGMNLESIAARAAQVEAEVKAIQSWARSINAWAKAQGFVQD